LRLTCYQLVLGILFAAQVAFLGVRAPDSRLKTDASLAVDILSPIATAVAIVVAFLDHQRSSRPSTLLSLYLSASVLLGIPRLRTLWLISGSRAPPGLMTVIFSFSTIALILQSTENKAGLKSYKLDAAPETWSGLWSRTGFVWLLTTFRLGYSTIISVDDLPPLDTKIESRVLRKTLVKAWSKSAC
jgi:ATP-binding cassette, subfamily C (CFTR/MRP), member 1